VCVVARRRGVASVLADFDARRKRLEEAERRHRHDKRPPRHLAPDERDPGPPIAIVVPVETSTAPATAATLMGGRNPHVPAAVVFAARDERRDGPVRVAVPHGSASADPHEGSNGHKSHETGKTTHGRGVLTTGDLIADAMMRLDAEEVAFLQRVRALGSLLDAAAASAASVFGSSSGGAVPSLLNPAVRAAVEAQLRSQGWELAPDYGSCFYPFQHHRYSRTRPARVAFQVRLEGDPYLEVQRQTRGTFDFFLEHTNAAAPFLMGELGPKCRGCTSDRERHAAHSRVPIGRVMRQQEQQREHERGEAARNAEVEAAGADAAVVGGWRSYLSSSIRMVERMQRAADRSRGQQRAAAWWGVWVGGIFAPLALFCLIHAGAELAGRAMQRAVQHRESLYTVVRKLSHAQPTGVSEGTSGGGLYTPRFRPQRAPTKHA
jgi:hypothetical protein